jgi:hypothetical protein
MKKITLFLMCLMPFMALAQTVSGTPSNTGCPNAGQITASSTGLGASPQYQLLKAGVVQAPVAGDATQFTTTTLFTGLSNGTYTLKGRANAIGTIYTSANIIVSDGYTTMTISTPTKTTPCASGGTEILITTTAGGKSPYTYSIKNGSNVVLETSAPTTSLTYPYAALPIGSYTVSVTDACGITVIGPSSITYNNGIQIANVSVAPQNGSTVLSGKLMRLVTGNCTSPIVVSPLLLKNTSSGTTLSTTEKGYFSYRLIYNGSSYGQDTNADGYPDIAGANFSVASPVNIKLPGGVFTFANAFAGNASLMLYDTCGNTKALTVTNSASYTVGSFTAFVCGTNISISTTLRTTEICLPISYTFTNTTNPANVVMLTQNSTPSTGENSSNQTTITSGNFMLGATYSVSYVDNAGTTSGLFPTTNVIIPASSNLLTAGLIVSSTSVYNSSRILPYYFNNAAGNIVNCTVTASNNPSVAVGYSANTTMVGPAAPSFQVNGPGLDGSFPAGIYTIAFTYPCGTISYTYNLTNSGYKGILDSLSTSATCGGFNVVANTSLVESTLMANYEIVIVSGTSGVGTTRSLFNTTTSQPFNGLPYGTYRFGIRIKGSTAIFNFVDIIYNATNAITDSTLGSYVCNNGDTNGVLTITASSLSPAPGNVLQYALSTDGGVTYGTYQAGNTFSGLTNITYYYKIQDGCGNVIIASSQIGVSANPVALADDTPDALIVCESSGGTIQLNTDISGALSYNWTGPGITAGNATIQNPVINKANLAVGNNSYTVTISNAAPCTGTRVANLTITVSPIPAVPTVNTVVASSCSASTGQLTLNGLPSGSWTINQSGAVTNTITGNTTTQTLTGLAAGNYSFTVTTSSGCTSISNVLVTIPTLTTTWNGTSWSNGSPTLSSAVVINGNYDTTTNPNIIACNVTVNSPYVVNIAANTNCTIENELDVASGATFTIADDASLVQINNAAVNTGTISVFRTTNIRLMDYVFWSSPVLNFPVTSVSPLSSTNSIYNWNPTIANSNNSEGSWINTTEYMRSGKGYIIRGPGSFSSTVASPFTAAFMGIPHNGIYTITIERGNYNSTTNYVGSNGVTINRTMDNLNLIGNPYPSAIDALSFLTANTAINGAVRLWTHNTTPATTIANPHYGSYGYNYSGSDYIVYNGTATTSGPTGFNGKIAAGQGFFVIMNDGAAGTGTVSFNNSMRSNTYNNSQFYKGTSIPKSNEANQPSRLWLDLISDGGEVSRTVVGYVDGATASYDRMFDAVCDYNINQSIYSVLDNDIFIIQGRANPLDVNDVVPMGIKTPTTGNYTVAIAYTDGVFENANQKVYLVDKLNGVSHNLTNSPYTFNSVEGIVNDRFELRYMENTLNNSEFNIINNDVFVNGENEIIHINAKNANIVNVQVYDVLGRLLVNTDKINAKQYNIGSITQSKQSLIFKITLDSGIVVTKKFIY